MYIVVLKVLELLVHSDKIAQIAFLLTKKVMILDKYFDFTNVFSEKKILVLLEQTELNKHAIKLNENK